MLGFVALFFCGGVAAERPWHQAHGAERSRLELISRLQHDEHSVASRRELQSASTASAALTAANTHPLRFKLDFASLYEATAPEYTACFAVGAWYRRGLPRDQPTPPAVETCDANGDGSDCWGRTGRCAALDPA